MEQFPISMKGYKCIGHCYYPNTYVIHPITQKNITNKKNNFCPVNEIDEKGEMILTDKCYIPTHKIQEDSITNIFPTIKFNRDNFLRLYNINSFEDGIRWIENNDNLPIETIKRIIDCLISVYNNKNLIITTPLIKFFIRLTKNKLSYEDLESKLIKYVNSNQIYDIEKIKSFLKKSIHKI